MLWFYHKLCELSSKMCHKFSCCFHSSSSLRLSAHLSQFVRFHILITPDFFFLKNVHRTYCSFLVKFELNAKGLKLCRLSTIYVYIYFFSFSLCGHTQSASVQEKLLSLAYCEKSKIDFSGFGKLKHVVKRSMRIDRHT